jgi:hypothetical protein
VNHCHADVAVLVGDVLLAVKNAIANGWSEPVLRFALMAIVYVPAARTGFIGFAGFM